MRFSFRKVAYGVLAVYTIVTCYTGFLLVKRRAYTSSGQEQQLLDRIKSLSEMSDDADWNPWGEEFDQNEGLVMGHHDAPVISWGKDQTLPPESSVDLTNHSTTQHYVVEVWGKAAISLYLWEHIFKAELEDRLGGIWSYGNKELGRIHFRFRTGPGVIPSKVPVNTENVLLILNGREDSKVKFAKIWLDFLATLPQLRNAAVVLLGSEQCNNEWINPYMHAHGGPLRFVFLVYDSPRIDNIHFYQWPLGVATYRSFPKVENIQVLMGVKRKYMCNFLGTIYKNSSREILLTLLENSLFRNSCYIKPRYEWLSQETEETKEDYLHALAESDLTLNPVGQNTECYRIYEAMSYGSVPVVEDVMTPGHCGSSAGSSIFPLRVLKELNAPLIYIKNWKELPEIFNQESRLTLEVKLKRRQNLIQWYENFRSVMQDRLVGVLEERFFNLKH